MPKENKRISSQAALLMAAALIVTMPIFSLFGTFKASGSISLNLSPPSGSYNAGQTFKVNVFINPNGEAYDVVRANISYSPDKLEVISFALNEAFNYPAGGNGFDNDSGRLTYGGGVAGGTTQALPFGTITFKTKSSGEAQVALNSDSLALSAGENRFNGRGSSSFFKINPAAAASPSSSAKPPAGTSSPSPTPEESTATTTPTETPEINTAAMGDIELVKDDQAQSGPNYWLWIALPLAIVLAISGGFYAYQNKKIKNRK